MPCFGMAPRLVLCQRTPYTTGICVLEIKHNSGATKRVILGLFGMNNNRLLLICFRLQTPEHPSGEDSLGHIAMNIQCAASPKACINK